MFEIIYKTQPLISLIAMNKSKYSSYLSAVLACSIILSACSFNSSPPTAEEQAEKADRFIVKGGYTAAQNFAIDSVNEVWRRDGRAIEISILAPSAPGTYPLILYLPGLGEHAENGRLWRETWAKAGYAVFSLQAKELAEALKDAGPMTPPPDDDNDKPGLFSRSKQKPSNTLRDSELYYLGHQHFAQSAQQQHIDDLLWAYAQLKQRAKTGNGLFATADVSRVIVAGYDLGAQTASILIGEKSDADLSKAKDFKPLAAMLFSPSMDMALGNVASRYKNMRCRYWSLPAVKTTIRTA